MVNFHNKKILFGVLFSIFFLTITFPAVTFSEEKPAARQNVLRQASLEWMKVGIRQYQSDQFTDAEQSFRRALVFKKYLTDAELSNLNEYLTKTRTAITEGKQPIENMQPFKAVEEVKSSEPLPVNQSQQTEKEPTTINSQIGQPVLSATTTEPIELKVQTTADSPRDAAIVVKDESLRAEYMRLSDWLGENRRNVLMVGLPVLGVLVIIMKLQGLKRRPGRRVYANPALANGSFIGANLVGNHEKKRRHKVFKRGHSIPAAESKPKRKGFEQKTDHWREKHFGHSNHAGKKPNTSEVRPQRKEESETDAGTVTKTEKKECTRCKKLKPHSEFYKNRSTRDGLARWCKQCKAEYRKQRAADKK